MKLRIINYFTSHDMNNLIWRIFRFFLLAGVCFVLLFPLLYMLSTAFRPAAEINDPSVIWIPKHLTLENFKISAEAINYKQSLSNTARVGVVSSILQIISCLVIGYGFARFKFKEKKLIFSMLLFTIIVPPQTIILSLFLNFRFFDFFGILSLQRLFTDDIKTLNLINTPWTFYLPSIFGMGIRSGLFIYIYRQFFRGMPKELEYAARIDGCGVFATFIKIMVPNSVPAILTVFLFSIVWHWNDYYLSAMYFSSNFPLSVSLSQIRSGLQIAGAGSEYSSPDLLRTYLQAGCLLTILPVLILYMVTQRYFTESIERTGIVG